jgi:hypothetical protein
MAFVQAENAPELHADLQAKWAAVREQISVLALWHPDPTVRRMADELSTEACRYLNRTSWMLVDLARGAKLQGTKQKGS